MQTLGSKQMCNAGCLTAEMHGLYCRCMCRWNAMQRARKGPGRHGWVYYRAKGGVWNGLKQAGARNADIGQQADVQYAVLAAEMHGLYQMCIQTCVDGVQYSALSQTLSSASAGHKCIPACTPCLCLELRLCLWTKP